jgi:cytochrome c biogenesis protein CcmG/thiol:disulfide interchange protein DsbE
VPRINNIILSLLFIFCFETSAYANQATDFSLKGNNSTINLKNHKGHVIYLDFWASWCKPCRKSFPFLNDMHNKYKKQGLVVIGINLDTEKKDAHKFLAKYPANFTVAYDPQGKTPEAYKLSVMPTSYLIDARGRIIYTHKGFKDDNKADIENRIKKALSKK